MQEVTARDPIKAMTNSANEILFPPLHRKRELTYLLKGMD